MAAEDIFGDDLSISSEDDLEQPQKKKKALIIEEDEDEDRGVQRYDDDAVEEEEEKVEEKGGETKTDVDEGKVELEEEEPVPETRIDVEVPKITTDLGKELHFVKLPNFLSIDCRPFDAETYEDEIEDEDCLDEEGRARLKLKVENTIRWRQSFDDQGKSVKESNARMVKWSDGSYSLHLGNEIFDVHKQPLQGDFNHLFIRQGTGLQGQAVFRTKLSFRPHSTESFTHQKMTRSMADRTNKAAGIKVISQVGRDPEANRYKRVKEEEERLRADMRRDSKMKRVRERAQSSRMTSGYLEEEGGDSDQEDGISLAAIKNKYKKNKKGADKQPIYSSDEEEESDIETGKAKRLEHAKKAAIRDSEEEEEDKRSRSRSPQQRRSSSKSRSRSRSSSPAASKSGGSEAASPKKSGSDSD